VAAATRSRELADRLNLEGVEPVGSSPEEFAAHIKVEFGRVRDVVKALGGKLE
jgi:tripartite-type tricarboxylate transporter receptor subunit TctC